MSKRRIVLLVGVVAIMWGSVFAPLVSGADETRPGGTTGLNWVSNKYVWTGDVTGYSAGEAIYHLEVQAETIVRARWECTGANGETDQFNGHIGGGEWDVSDGDFVGAKRSFTWGSDPESPLNETYCSYHVWRFSGSGGFRITTAQVDFWHKETDPGGGGGSPGPGTSVSGPSASPGPSEAPPDCVTVQQVTILWETVEYPMRKITWCELTFTDAAKWRLISGSWQQCDLDSLYGGTDAVTVLSGETSGYQRTTIGANNVSAIAYEATVNRVGAHVEGVASCGIARTDPWYQYGYTGSVTPGTVHEHQTMGVTAGWNIGPAMFVDNGLAASQNIVVTLTELWLGPTFGTESGDRPWDGEDVTPTPTPSASPSATPTPTPPPDPPVGYFLPLPDSPSPGPNLGGSEGLIDPSPQPHNPTGIAECDDDDGTFSKVGQAPLQPLHDTSFPGSVNPLDYLPWLGNMVSNIPIVVSNVGQWSSNTAVDFVVPGDCVSDILVDQQTQLFSEGPLSVYEDVKGQLESAMAATQSAAAAGNCTFAVPLPGGGEECIPFQSWSESIGGARNFLVVGVWFFTLIGCYHIITGAFKTARAAIDHGGSVETWAAGR